MPPPRLPTEVELAYEVMPCNAMRVAQEPLGAPHPCSYFRKWGTYHSYDYATAGPPPSPGIVHETVYVGRSPLVPELVSGCRKAPILAVGINPNLPGWWANRRNSLNPTFDEVKQYAHYFRYRAVDKLEVPKAKYTEFGGSAADTPFSTFELGVEAGPDGQRKIPVKLQPQSMYEAYQSLLDGLAEARGWAGHKLTVGEDLAYGNMVACPSAKWSTVPTAEFPAMSEGERKGIVGECFHERRYFLRQLFQSLPHAVLIFSQATATAFIAELKDRFVAGNPEPGESLTDLMQRTIRLQYGVLGDSTSFGGAGRVRPARDREPGRVRTRESQGHRPTRGGGGGRSDHVQPCHQTPSPPARGVRVLPGPRNQPLRLRSGTQVALRRAGADRRFVGY